MVDDKLVHVNKGANANVYPGEIVTIGILVTGDMLYAILINVSRGLLIIRRLSLTLTLIRGAIYDTTI